jgi:LysM repeat protein
MKSQLIPVKRRPASKGIMNRLQARRQRAAAADPADMEDDSKSINISRAIFILFMIKILAITLMFFHYQFLDKRTTSSKAIGADQARPSPATARSTSSSTLSSGEKPYIVRVGDSYPSIANAHNVNVSELIELNGQAELRPGLILKIPAMKQLAEVAVANTESQPPTLPTKSSSKPTETTSEPLPVEAAPPRAVPVVTEKRHVVKRGESIYRIAKEHGVSQESLMKANGITDPRKLAAGAKLIIPQP